MEGVIIEVITVAITTDSLRSGQFYDRNKHERSKWGRAACISSAISIGKLKWKAKSLQTYRAHIADIDAW